MQSLFSLWMKGKSCCKVNLIKGVLRVTKGYR